MWAGLRETGRNDGMKPRGCQQKGAINTTTPRKREGRLDRNQGRDLREERHTREDSVEVCSQPAMTRKGKSCGIIPLLHLSQLAEFFQCLLWINPMISQSIRDPLKQCMQVTPETQIRKKQSRVDKGTKRKFLVTEKAPFPQFSEI